MSSKTFCPLPWIHLATRPNGDVRLCCTANASGANITDEKEAGLVKHKGCRMNLKDYSIEEIWNSDHMKFVRLQMLNNEIPISCKKCFVEEDNGIVSKRQWETAVWKERIDIDKIISNTKDDGSLPVEIPYFDLRLGNVCQLKCVMCSPHDSSSWIKDWKLMYPNYKSIELKTDQQWDSKFDYTWYQKSNFLDTMKNQSHHIKELYFAGGEPLLIPEHYKILEFMIDTGQSKNCIIRYNSNGLALSQKLFDLWKHFKEVKFNLSIDAVGERNNYIRYPSKWDKLVTNLQILDNTPDNITVNIACAVQALNVLYITELVQWKLDQNFKKINLPPYGAGLIGTHLVYLPSYLNVRILTTELKYQAKQQIDNFCTSQSHNIEFQTNPYGLRRWQGLIDYMFKEDWTEKLPLFKEYIESIDRQRDLSFAKTFPELTHLL